MKRLNEGSKYWLQLFRQMCSQASIDEWDGIDFYDIAKAAQNGDKSAKEAIFWQMRNIIEATYAKNKKSVYLWSNQLGLFEKNPEGPSQVNEMALNWISTSWTVIFDGYPVSDGETVGPLIKHVQPTKGLDYLSWIYSKKILNLLYKEYYLNSSTGLSKNKGIDSISANLYADKRQDNGGEHSIKREIIDDWQSETNLPEEDLAVSDALRSFRKFTRDPELNEKKHGFSPMIAFRTVIMNMAKGADAEKNVANLAAKYNVSRNTFASYAKEAATTLVNKYDVSLDELQQLIKVYGSGALGRLIKESSYKPKPLARINENYDFRLLESIFNGKVLLSESDESIYDAHDEYIKDVEQKKKEDDNQENFKFDEGSVKLTTVKENKKKYWNNFFDSVLKESRGTYTGNIAECPCCGHTIHQDQYEDYTCEECGEFWDDDDLDWHPDGDEYEDGEDNRVVIDPLELMSESVSLKEHENPYAPRAAAICKSLTKDIDFDNDDNAWDKAADILVEFIDSMIEQSMDYFPVDEYEPELYKIWEEHEKRHE